jgi:uncharacterized membrane protein YhaH (DUF805 family)
LNKIILTLFAELKLGRLARLPFILYVTGLQLSLLLFLLWVAFSAGLAEPAASGDLEAVQQALTDWMSLPTLLMSAVFALPVIFAHFNILAKRIRDIGLPGWISLLVYVIVRSLLGTVAGLVLDLLFMILLCFVASNAIKKNRLEPGS